MIDKDIFCAFACVSILISNLDKWSESFRHDPTVGSVCMSEGKSEADIALLGRLETKTLNYESRSRLFHKDGWIIVS